MLTVKFCVENLRNHSNNKRNCDYERVLSKMREINTSISITGGEHTANSRFIELVKLVDKYKFRKNNGYNKRLILNQR